MFHKKHWDFIKTKGENYDKINQELEADLRKYVKNQLSYDSLYLIKNVSFNAHNSFYNFSKLNELIAEVFLQKEKRIVKDKVLLKTLRKCFYDDKNYS